MQYLTYEEYQEIGGALDLTAFNRYCDRVFGVVDNATFGRIEAMEQIPRQVKALCRDLIEYFTNQETNGKIQSRSQSAGAVSESISYVTKSDAIILSETSDIIFDYLASVHDDCGVPLLYRGCKY